MTDATHSLLLKRRFTAEVQKDFAHLSGDYNPMHDDPVAARRTLAGGQVVHGVHLALAAMETALAHQQKRGTPGRTIASVTALFLKPVLMGETIDFHLAETAFETDKLIGRRDEENVCEISIRWGAVPAAPDIQLPSLCPEPIVELRFDELTGRAGNVEIGLDQTLAREMFPLALAAFGPIGIAEILSLSRLVGMQCPGLRSLFYKFAVNFRETPGRQTLSYRVKETDERFQKIVMQVDGSRIEGRVTAFVRPPPQRQPGMGEVAGHVESGSLAQSTALIVGGSRGLGEVTARIIAAGGGLPIITYYQCAADAERVAEDIRSAGGKCEVRPLDIRQAEAFLQQLSIDGLQPRSLYYFATPKIFGRRRGFFDHDLLRDFQEVYLTAFGRLLEGLLGHGAAKLRVFYPSSTAVDEGMREMAEYAMAKRAGEDLCAFYNQHSKRIEIIAERLPRIRTDQTSTLVAFPAEDGLEVMLPLVRKMELPLQQPNKVS